MPTDSRYSATSRTLETARGRLHYHETGTGAPLILLHGSGPGVNGWQNFQGNLDAFAKHFHTFILDLPGFGGSDAFEGYPIDTGMEATLLLMDALHIERAHVLGNSMGGIVGARLAAEHPQRVTRLCSIGGVGTNLFTTFPNEGINLLVDFTEQPSRERLTAWLHSMVYDPALITPELVEERWRLATQPETMEVSRRLYSREAMQMLTAVNKKTASWTYLENIECPTLVVWGRDDRVSPLDRAIVPMRVIPKCELHVFHDCGHWAMIERKAEFESVVIPFFLRAN